MLLKKLNSNLRLGVTALANGVPCPEYFLPYRNGLLSPDNIFEAIIPIQDGDKLSVALEFSGAIIKATFDLLVDGSFVAQKEIKPDSGTTAVAQPSFKERKRVFDKAFSRQVDGDSVETSMIISQIQDKEGLEKLSDGKHDALGRLTAGLGSIVVIASVKFEGQGEAAEQLYRPQKASDMHIGGWRQRDSVLSSGGILPEHEIVVDDEAVNMSANQIKTHESRWKAKRLGAEPFATLIFYYRTADAISAAQCEIRSNVIERIRTNGQSADTRSPQGKARAIAAPQHKNGLFVTNSDCENSETDETAPAGQQTQNAYFDTVLSSPEDTPQKYLSMFKAPGPQGVGSKPGTASLPTTPEAAQHKDIFEFDSAGNIVLSSVPSGRADQVLDPETPGEEARPQSSHAATPVSRLLPLLSEADHRNSNTQTLSNIAKTGLQAIARDSLAPDWNFADIHGTTELARAESQHPPDLAPPNSHTRPAKRSASIATITSITDQLANKRARNAELEARKSEGLAALQRKQAVRAELEVEIAKGKELERDICEIELQLAREDELFDSL